MSIFGKKLEGAPVGLPSPDGGKPVELAPGARVVRRPIYQAQAGQENLQTMATRIGVAKTLGFTMFEIDVTSVQVRDEKQEAYGLSMLFLGARPVTEGEEWKESEKSKTVAALVVTVYALVVE